MPVPTRLSLRPSIDGHYWQGRGLTEDISDTKKCVRRRVDQLVADRTVRYPHDRVDVIAAISLLMRVTFDYADDCMDYEPYFKACVFDLAISTPSDAETFIGVDTLAQRRDNYRAALERFDPERLHGYLHRAFLSL